VDWNQPDGIQADSEHGNEHSGSMQIGIPLDQLADYQVLNKYFAAWR
jgi:hypothetical protein